MAFSALDALFTLLQLEGGSREINPFMNWALSSGVPVFVMVKMFLTAVGAFFLAVHQNFRYSWVALHAASAGYGLLLVYHVSLFLRPLG
jgi:hypothetical protein